MDSAINEEDIIHIDIKEEPMEMDFENEQMNTINIIDYQWRCGQIKVTTNGELKFHCNFCENHYVNFEFLSEHIKTNHYPIKSNNKTQKPLQNPLNAEEKKFGEIYASESGEFLHICSLCNNENFKSVELFSDHINDKHKNISTAGSIDLIKSINSDEEVFNCNKCKKTFASNEQLCSHQLTTHNNNNKKRPLIQCKFCSQCFRREDMLIKHETIHTGEIPHKCELCLKVCPTLSEFKRHMITHTGEKPYQCTVCPKAYGRVSDLNRHSLSHTGVKAHKCEICNQYFTRNSYKRHEIVHAVNRPYQCSICFKTFKRKDTQISHELLHSDIKPFECEHCLKTFASENHLRRHIRNHIPLLPVSAT